jgi:CheY-like chemotaxis protein
MRDLLEAQAGYAVLVCREWDQAYAFIKEHCPDLVILDIRIGGEEQGWAILNLLTLDPQTRPIPVIVCSVAIQSLHDHQSWLDKFGICALPKPFDLDMLLELIGRVLAPCAREADRSCAVARHQAGVAVAVAGQPAPRVSSGHVVRGCASRHAGQYEPGVGATVACSSLVAATGTPAWLSD